MTTIIMLIIITSIIIIIAASFFIYRIGYRDGLDYANKYINDYLSKSDKQL